MIFILHYILLNAGLSAIIILLALFLQTYSDASLTEIGALLMVLPFLSIVIKPLVCALADRQQAHKNYLIGSLAFMILGYGSLALAPFYPEFVKEHGRLVWYLDMIGIIIGFSAFGVTWSLGDALAVNAARIKGIPWGSYRVWATVSWGVFGVIIGQINETPLLPKYVPAFIVFIVSILLEILLLAFWSNKDFDMGFDGDQQQQVPGSDYHHQLPDGGDNKQEDGGKDSSDLDDNHWPINRSFSGTFGTGSARMNPRLMGAMANIFMEDIGSSIKSSLKLGQPQKRTALADILEQHQINASPTQPPGSLPPMGAVAAASTAAAIAQHQHSSPSSTQKSPQGQHSLEGSPISMQKQGHSPLYQLNKGGHSPAVSQAAGSHTTSSRAATLGKSALRRTQLVLSRMNSLSSASGLAIADEVRDSSDFGSPPTGGGGGGQHQSIMMMGTGHHQQLMIMSSLASQASLSKAAAARALGFGGGLSSSSINAGTGGKGDMSPVSKNAHADMNMLETVNESIESQKSVSSSNKSVEDLQLVLLKIIIKRDRSILKYLIIFTLFGFLLFVHISYFFIHVEKLCREKDYDFSTVMGSLVAAQSISEIFTFLVLVPHYMPRVGRPGSVLTCAIIFIIRYAYYGTYFSQFSPYYALATETCHGIAYGISYTLITDIAAECVNQVDIYLPELIQRRLVDPNINPNQLKLPLRATMQGVFSGAFDGLGNGIAALFAGIYLDSYSFASLWLFCTYVSLAIVFIYPLTEWRSLCAGRRATVVNVKH